MTDTKPVLMLHRDADNLIWYNCGNRSQHPAVNACEAPPESFLGVMPLKDYSRIRVMGTARNAELIESLHTRRKKAWLPAELSIQIGSPVICDDIDDGHAAMRAMWYALTNKELGGRWFELEDRDISTYSLVAEMHRNGMQPNDKVRRILMYHPAWPALSFIPTLDIDAACALVGLIVDLRWFMHTVRPNRASKLYNFLGVSLENAQHVASESPDMGRRYDNFALTMKAWAGMPTPATHMDPAGFLHRICATSPDRVKGFLSANKKFVRFIREVWLQELSPQRELFSPEAFFKGKEEVDAYRKHRLTLGGRPHLFDV